MQMEVREVHMTMTDIIKAEIEIESYRAGRQDMREDIIRMLELELMYLSRQMFDEHDPCVKLLKHLITRTQAKR